VFREQERMRPGNSESERWQADSRRLSVTLDGGRDRTLKQGLARTVDWWRGGLAHRRVRRESTSCRKRLAPSRKMSDFLQPEPRTITGTVGSRFGLTIHYNHADGQDSRCGHGPHRGRQTTTARLPGREPRQRRARVVKDAVPSAGAIEGPMMDGFWRSGCCSQRLRSFVCPAFRSDPRTGAVVWIAGNSF